MRETTSRPPFKAGDQVRFKLPWRGTNLPYPGPEAFLVTEVEDRGDGLYFIHLAGYGLPVVDFALVHARRPRIPTNPWPKLRGEWEAFLAEIENNARGRAERSGL